MEIISDLKLVDLFLTKCALNEYKSYKVTPLITGLTAIESCKRGGNCASLIRIQAHSPSIRAGIIIVLKRLLIGTRKRWVKYLRTRAQVWPAINSGVIFEIRCGLDHLSTALVLSMELWTLLRLHTNKQRLKLLYIYL